MRDSMALRLFERVALLSVSAFVFFMAGLEFYNIAWGTGKWLGEFSFKWALLFFLFVLVGMLCLVGLVVALWFPSRYGRINQFFLSLRLRSGPFRWVLAVAVLIVPVWFLEFTSWGVVIHGSYLRLLIWCAVSLLLGLLVTRDSTRPLTWSGALVGLVLLSGTFAFAAPFREVTSYPFSLGWSEGNRLWDYSVLFEHRLYLYSPDKPINAFIDIGRQFIGGLPFLLPHISIWGVRFWLALTFTIPYLLLGWVIFAHSGKTAWVLAGLWGFAFLNQGPIHSPLILCAILVAIAWERPLWLAVPLVLISGYFAQASRFTWLFAPGMWAGMLELSGVALNKGKLGRLPWIRAIAVGLAGVFGGYFAPSLINWLKKGPGVGQGIINLGGRITVAGAASAVTQQPLLWYRLFPNATYGYGIFLGLLLAVGPLITLLIYLARTGRWSPNLWQKLVVALPLLAFLVVGLVASTKIGGGGDLHNLDMFLIGIFFAGAIAWKQGGRAWINRVAESPRWIQVVMLLLVALPAYQPLMSLRPLAFSDDLNWLITLTDSDPAGKSLESLPSAKDVDKSLAVIRQTVDSKKNSGEVLFMDQRQLLTFGYIQDVPLVPEYDKKLLMDKALSGDGAYFQTFYDDLATHRFSLIISNPLRVPIKDREYNFSEENNAWVKWVAGPVLCYYEPEETMKDVQVQLLVPQQDSKSCDLPSP
jgi:hypothetical protein